MSMTLASLMVCALLGGEDVPQIEVRLAGAQDQIELQSTEDGVIVAVTSPRGIGRATLLPTGDDWPATVTLRLALGDLEGFDLTTGGLRLHAFLGGETTEINRTAEADEDLPPDDELQLVIRQAGEGQIEVELPPALLEYGPAEIEIQWVDWYR